MTTAREADAELARFYDLNAKYTKMLAEFREDNLYVDQEFETAGIIPDDTTDKGLKLTKPSSVSDAVENASDHILSFPRTTVPIRSVVKGEEKQIEIARKKQNFIEACWERFFYDQGDPLGAAKKQLIEGKAVVRLDIEWRYLPKMPDNPTPADNKHFREVLQKVSRSKFVWRLRIVPKETVFEDIENPHDPPCLYECFETTAREVWTRWPHLKGKLGGRADLDRVQYLEYWSKPSGSDPGRFIQWVDDERVHDAENPYCFETPLHTDEEPDYEGRIPHVIGDPGWGHVRAEAKPEDRYVSLVRPMRSMALADCRLLTEMEAYLRLYIWKVLMVSGYPDDQEFPVGPGQVWEKDPESQSIELLNFGEMPVSLLQGMERVRHFMDEHSKFGALGGTPQRGVDTASEAMQNVQNASSKLSGPVRTLRRMVARINSYILQDLEMVLESPVTLYGVTNVSSGEVTLAPKEIGGFYQTHVELDTSDEAQLSMRVARVFADLYQRLPISAEGVLEKAGYGDPKQEMRRRFVEDLERSPAVMQTATIAMLEGVAMATPAATVVNSAFQRALANVKPQQGSQQPGGMDAMPTDETIQTQARDNAIADQPEAAYQ